MTCWLKHFQHVCFHQTLVLVLLCVKAPCSGRNVQQRPNVLFDCHFHELLHPKTANDACRHQDDRQSLSLCTITNTLKVLWNCPNIFITVSFCCYKFSPGPQEGTTFQTHKWDTWTKITLNWNLRMMIIKMEAKSTSMQSYWNPNDHLLW